MSDVLGSLIATGMPGSFVAFGGPIVIGELSESGVSGVLSAAGSVGLPSRFVTLETDCRTAKLSIDWPLQ